MRTLSRSILVNIFSNPASCLCTFFMLSFAEWKFLIFMNGNLRTFISWSVLCLSCLRTCCRLLKHPLNLPLQVSPELFHSLPAVFPPQFVSSSLHDLPARDRTGSLLCTQDWHWVWHILDAQ